MTTNKNTLDIIWLGDEGKKYLMILPVVGLGDLTVDDICKMALTQDKQEDDVVSFSFQKFSRDTFEKFTKVTLGDSYLWVCVRVFEKKDGLFVETNFSENDDKVKVRLLPLDTSLGKDFIINENPAPEDLN